ncbi:hypothetical protein [Streptacidiphilus griseoplanus]|uniref:hypothetical protein n=1 Tax=Peterkaempfera griseoplana TaxID=66896 RepID=UPI001FE02B7D|nr:hypothetical protein [Peterkaempfera griseoplana]
MNREIGRRKQEQAVARLWKEHVRTDFPARLRGEELAGVDLVLLDTYVAGCVSTWLSNRGSLDEERRQILRDCLADLDTVLPLLTETQEVRYYERLRELAVLASQNAA